MAKVQCPACKHVSEIATDKAVHEAPFHCPECLGLYFVHIEGETVMSCEPLTESGYARWKMAQQPPEQS